MNEMTLPMSGRNLARGLATQARVIGALTIRELHGRFGRHNIAFLWMVAEPMMLASVISLVHEFAKIGSEVKGIHPYAFILIGYNIYIIFRNVFNRADHMLDHSSYLLYHNIIKPMDIIISKAIVETVGAITSLFLLIAAGTFFGVAEFPVRPIYLILALALMTWLSLALSILIAAYTYDSHFLSRFVHPFSYLMIPLSGAFVTMSILSDWAQGYMAWNPLMCIFEIARYGQFEHASNKFIYPEYVAVFCAACTYWGLLALRRVERKIHVS